MLVSLRRAGAVILLALAGTVMPSACVRNDSTLFIRGCLAVPPESCEVTPSASATLLFSGSIDPGYRAAYKCFALVENQMVARGSPTTLRTETSRISLYEANVEVYAPSATAYDGTLLSQFTVPISGFVDPGTGTDPGYGATEIALTDATTLQKAKPGQTLVAKVEAHGRTLGGLEVQSNIFEYQITATTPGGSCCEPAGQACRGDGITPTANCLLGQDQCANCQLLPDAALVQDSNGDWHCP